MTSTRFPSTEDSLLDALCMNTLRFLSIDAVQKAASGHPERGLTRRVSKGRSVHSPASQSARTARRRVPESIPAVIARGPMAKAHRA
ncbi:hypothetical protein [Burkholderia sp. PR2]|uniref:hypothetical protein n=1 Tax=Burkholderia sp. PR2 TaxID=3448078 RepID=UPI00402AC5E0